MAPPATSTERRCFAFIFGQPSGHINPSFPVARQLVQLGHEVHYLSRAERRAAIEDTGATFHEDVACCPELYEGRVPDPFGAAASFMKEFGIEESNMTLTMARTRIVTAEKAMPGVIRLLRSIRADAVMYDPLCNAEAAYASAFLGLPAIALMTLAGAGALATSYHEFIRSTGTSLEEMQEVQETFEPHLAAVERLRSEYNLDVKNVVMPGEPFGKLDILDTSHCTLITTCEDLQDPMSAELKESYERAGAIFESVGALLDCSGALRAAGQQGHDCNLKDGASAGEEALSTKLAAAKAAGRAVVYVSMGTMITGNTPMSGWHTRFADENGQEYGLSGRELCQAVWGGAFDALGESEADAGPLLIVSLGPQANALGELEAPPNAICMPVVPQVDVLRSSVDVFVTHGGQNSFTEALTYATPLVVCPGVGDQVVNAQKAVDLGVGLKVDRPWPKLGDVAEAAQRYRLAVRDAVSEVFKSPSFKQKAQECETRLSQAGGVPRAVEIMLQACEHRSTSGRDQKSVPVNLPQRNAQEGRVAVAGA